MSDPQRRSQPRREQPPSDELVLAAVERAGRHRAGERLDVPIRSVLEHLDLPRRSSAARHVLVRLNALAADGAVEAGRRHGIATWALTQDGRRRLAASPHALAGALPESPQHRAWRQARTTAELELERFRASLAVELDDARRLLDGEAAVASDAWLELAERLARSCRLLGSAAYCLYEWPEPSDDRADVDPGLEPGEDALPELERARLLARRRGRRNISLWMRDV
jgi:hypothetical protein